MGKTDRIPEMLSSHLLRDYFAMDREFGDIDFECFIAGYETMDAFYQAIEVRGEAIVGRARMVA